MFADERLIISLRLQDTETLSIVRKLSIDYVNFIREYWTNLSVNFR